MTTPIKQNSPDEEGLNAARKAFQYELRGDFGGILNEAQIEHLGWAAQDHFRKSKAGQVEEEGKCSLCGKQGNPHCPVCRKPEAVADHAQAVLQKALEALRPFHRLALVFDVEPYNSDYPDRLRLIGSPAINYHNFLTLGDCRRAMVSFKNLEELLSTQGVGEHAAGVSSEKTQFFDTHPLSPQIRVSIVEKDWRDVQESIDAAAGVPSPDKWSGFPHEVKDCQWIDCAQHSPSPQVEQVSAVQESLRDETPTTDVNAGDAPKAAAIPI